MTKPKNKCTAVVMCPKCQTRAEVFNFTIDETAAKWPQTAYHWCNNVCANLCGTNNGGALTVEMEPDEQDLKNISPAQATNEGKFVFNKDQLFDFYYKKMYHWCEVPGCEEKFYKEGSRGHHLCVEHYEQGLKIDAEMNTDNETEQQAGI